MQFKVANAYLAGGADQIFPTVPRVPEGGDPDTADGVYVNLDQWDGFQAERREISQAILDANEGQGVENFVVITGDIHSYIAGYVRENYDDQTPPARPRDGGRWGSEPEQQAPRDVFRVRLGDLIEPGGASHRGRQRGLSAGRREVPRVGGRA